MTLPEHRYAFRLEMHQEAVRLLEVNPALSAIALEVMQRWSDMSSLSSNPRMQQWKDLIEKCQWTQFLAGTDVGDELRRGSPVAFVVPAETRLRVLERYPIHRDK